MPAAPLPLDEEARLAALYAEDVLDSPAEPGFDRVVRLAQAAFGGDVSAYVNFVDRDRQWAKARLKLATDQSPRHGSIGSWALLEPDVMWVEDALADPRFDEARSVRTLGMRFFCGCPIRGRDDYAIGVLGVFDADPRPYDKALAHQMRDLAGVVTNELELRRGRARMQRDIVELMQAREEATKARERLDLALNLSDTVVWERSVTEQRLYAMGPIESVFEKRPGYDALTADIAYGVHPEDQAVVLEAWEHHIATGAPYRQEHRYARADGSEVWMYSLAEARYDADGALERVVGVMRDVTERKRFELELAAAKDVAQSASRAKSEFLANMSHELRTPLNGVMGIASALARTELDTRQREMLELIEGSAQTLERLLADILDLSRVESGRMALHPEPFDLGDLVQGVATLFQWRASDQGVAFTCSVSPGAQGAYCADAVRLRQILTNLVSNAVKFTQVGEIALRVDLAADGQLVFEVCDTGVGFDEAARKRLFRRFEQADASITRRYGGTGLGLAIARGLARLMGGDLGAVSTLGLGSTFRLTVPLPRVASSDAATVAAPLPAATPAPGLQVLLAEDHPVNRAVVELILQAAAVAVTSVENGREALDMLATRDFDLVLMDMQMPVMDGLTAIRALRAREAAAGSQPMPVIALTANALPEHVRASREAGADAHLAKPITAKALLAEVSRLADAGRAASIHPARRAG